MLERLERLGALLVFSVILMASSTGYVRALQSAHYKLDEGVLGAGGSIQSGSTNFQSRSSLGDLSVGHSESSNYQVESGSTTTKSPNLSFSVNASTSFGSFSAGSATMATSTFSVMNYTSYGYVVQIIGTTPTNNGHSLTAMSTASSSVPGSEQFGINVVANTLPQVIGANPDNGGFGHGEAAANYSTPNKYRYVSGETIAKAPKSSGVTNYTISYMANVAGLTPGGKYTSDQTLVVTGTY